MLNPSWRSSGDSRCGLGRLIPARTEFAGARVCGSDEKSFGEEEVRDLGFFPGGGTPFYSHRRSAVFIQDVEEAAVDRMLGGAPPSCLRPEEEDDKAKRYRGWVGPVLDFGQMGRGQVSNYPFFCLISFISCFLFCYF
jgi:hypothetical protein